MVVHTCNPSIGKAEAAGSLGFTVQATEPN